MAPPEPLASAHAPATMPMDFKAPGRPQVATGVDSHPRAASATISRPGPTSASALLHQLLQLGEYEELTPEDLRQVERVLLDLQLLGQAAVPDIHSFLLSGEDASLNSGDDLIYPYESLRLALIDLLKQVGGLEAEQALVEQLYAKVSVAELKAIADALESLAPEFYSESILEVAREWLTLFSAKDVPDAGRQSGPLFQVLQNYGDRELAATLYEVPYWLRDYALLALAKLPDGQGISGLELMVRRDLRAARDSRSLHLLAQAAAFEPQAEAALLALAGSGQIPDAQWPLIADILIGDSQLQIEDPRRSAASTGSLLGEAAYATHTIVDRQVQVIYSVNYSAVLPAEQAAARVDLVSRLMEAVGNPAATHALWEARNTLADYYF